MKPGDPVLTDRKRETSWKVHNVAFGVALKRKMDALGIEAILVYPGAGSDFTGPAHYLRAKLTAAAAP